MSNIKLEKVDSFLAYLRGQAEVMRDNAAQGGYMDDGGAKELEYQIEVYRAGLKGEVPQVWQCEYTKWLKQIDPEYQQFLRLREKFEGA